MPTTKEILEIAQRVAYEKGAPPPKTQADVERLSGYAYNGPDPEAIGKSYYVTVVQPK